MARKPTLSDQQHRRIAKQQAQLVNEADLIKGLVIANTGQHVLVELENQSIQKCFFKKNLGALVPGDKVLLTQNQSDTPVISVRLERDSELFRPDIYKQLKYLAANITQLAIVISEPPIFAPYYLDQYLVAAEYFNLKPLIILNKIDILSPDSDIYNLLKYYKNILNIPIVNCSADQKINLNQLKNQFKDHTSIIMGLSGVGKSSIVNSLFNQNLTETQTISEANQKGRHTTTLSKLYHLPSGGDLIDSPGIREFGLWTLDRKEIYHGFKEFKHLINQCKYRDCKHLNEPNCAIKHFLDSPNCQMPTSRKESLERMLTQKNIQKNTQKNTKKN